MNEGLGELRVSQTLFYAHAIMCRFLTFVGKNDE